MKNIILILLILTPELFSEDFTDPTGSYELDSEIEIRDDENFGYFGEIQVKKLSSEVPILKDSITEELLDSIIGDSNEINKFINDGFAILDTASGDLNLDGISDLILVLKNKDEENLRNEEFKNIERPLLILIRDSTNKLKIARKNSNTVYSNISGGIMGDPFVGVSIKNGFFSLEHYGGSAWRWSRSITFKYSKKENDWYLHKDVSTSFNANDLDSEDNYKEIIKTDKDFGKVKFEKFDIYIED